MKEGDDLAAWAGAGGAWGSAQGGRDRPGGTVMGTIDDLSDDEKTRAFLQLLEYKLRMEKEQKTSQEGQKDSSFHELWQQLPAHQINPVRWAGGQGQACYADVYGLVMINYHAQSYVFVNGFGPDPTCSSRETDEEKTVRQSIQVWYGINSSKALGNCLLLFGLSVYLNLFTSIG